MHRQFWALSAGLVIFLSCALAKAKETVVVGDSLSCGPFGKYLVQDLAKRGKAVTLYCAVSSAPANWMNGRNPPGQNCQTMTSSKPELVACGGNGQTPSFSTILSAHKDAEIIVALGTNSLLSGSADASYKAMAKAVAANGNPCAWVGPPQMNPAQSKGFPAGRVAMLNRNLNSFYDSLSSAVDSSCRLIDSRDATAASTAGNQTVDGVHRNDGAGLEWVRQISGKFNASPSGGRPGASVR